MDETSEMRRSRRYHRTSAHRLVRSSTTTGKHRGRQDRARCAVYYFMSRRLLCSRIRIVGSGRVGLIARSADESVVELAAPFDMHHPTSGSGGRTQRTHNLTHLSSSEHRNDGTPAQRSGRGVVRFASLVQLRLSCSLTLCCPIVISSS